MQTNLEVICLSQMTAKQGKAEELLTALKKLIPLSLQEPGCIVYEVWQDSINPLSYLVYERFQNQEALEKHIQTPYIQEFIQNEYTSCVASHWDADYRPT